MLQLDDIFLFVGQCGSCPRVADSNHSFQDMRWTLMDHFGDNDDDMLIAVSRVYILVSSPRFWVMDNHLGPYSEAPDRPDGQEHAAQAVGGQ